MPDVSTKILVSNDCFPQLQYDGFPLVARYRSAVARCGSGWNTKGNTGYITVKYIKQACKREHVNRMGASGMGGAMLVAMSDVTRDAHG